MKSAAAILILLSSVLFAGWLNGRKKRSLETLESIVELMEAVRAMLSGACPPVEDLLHGLASDRRFTSLGFPEKCKSRMSAGEPFPQAWKNAVTESAGACALSAENTRRLCAFGSRLGQTELEGQLSACELYAGLFSRELARAKEASGAGSRLNASLCICAGLAAAILIC